MMLSVTRRHSSPNLSVAADTIVNAAPMVGIVLMSSLLENWSLRTLWYNGSIAAKFNGQTAMAPWLGRGGYYTPPIRRWAFDQNFYQSQKLPPGTPLVGFIERLHRAVMIASADPSQ